MTDHERAAVKVKSLAWGETSYGTPEVHTVVGIYRIVHAGNGGWSANTKSEVLRDSDGRTNFATLDKAKAACQTHYEHCILSALAPQAGDNAEEPVAPIVNITTGMRELRASLIARTVRQSLRNYGHKSAESTLPECIATDVERALAADEKVWGAALASHSCTSTPVVSQNAPALEDKGEWVLVPKQPTAEMVKAGESWSGLPAQTWQDMIDAAPEAVDG